MKQICYVIGNVAWKDWVKVGFTTKSDMKSRLSTYQTGTPFRDYVVIHAVEFDDARKAEHEIHKNLKAMCGEYKNEWFKISSRMASNIIDTVKEDIDSGLL